MTAPRSCRGRWSGNIGLRMPVDVIGLDVDVYHGGRDTLDDLLAELRPAAVDVDLPLGAQRRLGDQVLPGPGRDDVDRRPARHRHHPTRSPLRRRVPVDPPGRTAVRLVGSGRGGADVRAPRGRGPARAAVAVDRRAVSQPDATTSTSRAVDLEELTAFIDAHDQADQPGYIDDDPRALPRPGDRAATRATTRCSTA